MFPSRTTSPEVEYLEKHLRRPLFNLDDYPPLYRTPALFKSEEVEDKNNEVLTSRNRKCYRLDEAGRVVALNLCQCDLEDLAFLRPLTGLRVLDLSENAIHDLSPLSVLTQLEKLHVGNNKLSNLSTLRALTRLSRLSIWQNEISDLTPLQDLSGLQSLYAWRNQIANLKPLSALSGLLNLNVSDNPANDLYPLRSLHQLKDLQADWEQIGNTGLWSAWSKLRNLSLYGEVPDWAIQSLQVLPQLERLQLTRKSASDWSSLTHLSQLRSLNLGGRSVRSLAFLDSLRQLEALDLSYNELSNIRPLERLTRLKTLQLHESPILNFSPLAALTHLQELHLGHKRMQNLPDFGALPSLRYLRVWGCSIQDWSPLEKLKQIKKLSIGYSPLRGVSALKDLSQLESLSLLNNSIDNVSSIAELKELKDLDVSGNRVWDVSPLGDLSQLQVLDLYNNRISYISHLMKLKCLRSLDIRKNQITKLPADVLKLRIELEAGGEKSYDSHYGSITWRGNPLEYPDPELLQRGHGAVEDYFRALAEGGKQTLREAKVLVVGEAEVGKTSLIKQLLGQPYNPTEPKTHDIGRHWLPLRCGAKGEIELRVWDFGGQEIMHATHQFFLTRRSVYVLVLNSRHNEVQCRIEYWLRLIASFGADAPVIVVCNKCDEEAMDLAWGALQKKFPQIKHFVKRVSCCMDPVTGKDQREGIEEVKQRIAEVVEEHLPEVGKPMPASWFAVKAELEEMAEKGADYLSLERYQSICEANKVTAGTESTLLDFLHDLGVVLHFGEGHPVVPQNNPLLSEMNVLTPAWVTAGIYKVVNDKALMLDDRGVLRPAKLRSLLADLPGNRYAGKEAYILEMMRRFELCIPIPDEPEAVLIPDLLPKDGPDTGEWKDALRLRIQYAVLPQSVMGRFIVRMQGLVSGKTYWRHGVVLKHEGVRALVQADLEAATIDIHLLETSEGTLKGRRSLLGAIRLEFERIHKTFSDKLGEKELVPDPEHPNVFESYAKLIEMEGAGESRVWIEGVGFRPIDAFLDGVSSDLERRAKWLWNRGIKLSEESDTTQEGPNSRESVATASTAPTAPTASAGLSWEWKSVVYGVAAMIAVAVFYWIPNLGIRVCIAAGAAVTTFMFFRNPETFWRRSFGLVLTAGLGWSFIASALKGGWSDGRGNHIEWNGELGWPGALVTVVLALGCLVGEWIQRSKKPQE